MYIYIYIVVVVVVVVTVTVVIGNTLFVTFGIELESCRNARHASFLVVYQIVCSQCALRAC